jgi:ABC-type multidrug transport system fused ATPase/permease subunit
MLFSGILAQEIGGGAQPERIGAAMRIACAEDIVEGMPDGLQTSIAERGLSVSGGERQRLKLARAIVADPQILVLVDPTSAVDSHTEALLGERLREGRAGRTTVVISTSPLLLSQADEVAFLSDGKVIVTGSHSELVESTPQYARVVLRTTA